MRRQSDGAFTPTTKWILYAENSQLSEDFDYVRVDLYAPDNEVYFAELTFTPGAGVLPFAPDKVDYEWGRLLTSTPS